MRQINKVTVFCLFTLLLNVLSCKPENPEKEAVLSSDSLDVPTENQLVEIGIQKLGEWTQFWKSKGADFNFSDFKPAQEYTYEALEWPGENVLLKENPLGSYQIPHPTSEGVVDIYGYKFVFNEDEEITFNPDSEVVYYKSDGMRERLLFMGPSGVFEDAVWITEDDLLVSGHIRKESGYVPVVWLIQPEEHQYTMYENNYSTENYTPESFLKKKLAKLDFPL